MLMAALATLAAVGLALQSLVCQVLGPRRLVGDEGEYLARGAAPDPFHPQPFLRMPLLSLLSLAAYRLSGSPEACLRWMLATASLLSVLATAATGWWAFGPSGGIVAGIALLAFPDRLILSLHIWPDPLLGLWCSVINFLLLIPPWGPSAALAAGACSALAASTRFEAAVLPGAIWLGLWASNSVPNGLETILLAAPTLLLLGGLALRNHRVYGIPWPDTTVLFNLALTRTEAEHLKDGPAIGELIARTRVNWDRNDQTGRRQEALDGLTAGLRRPSAGLRGLAQRLLLLMGPDTFIRQKLIASGMAYPRARRSSLRVLNPALAVAAPLYVALLTAAIAVYPWQPGAFVWPGLGLMTAAFAFHTRSRYRLAFWPTLCLLLGRQAATWPPDSNGWMALPAGLIVFAVLTTAPLRPESRPQPRENREQ